MKTIPVIREGRPATREEIMCAVEGEPLPASLESHEVIARENIMKAEAALMKAATEFAYQWGRDQTVHPKMYWLELHLTNWAELARSALAYAECVKRIE